MVKHELKFVIYHMVQDLKAQLAELRHSDESAKEQNQNLMKRLQEEKEFYTMNRDAMRAELESYKVKYRTIH